MILRLRERLIRAWDWLYYDAIDCLIAVLFVAANVGTVALFGYFVLLGLGIA